MDRKTYEAARKKAMQYFDKANIALTEAKHDDTDIFTDVRIRLAPVVEG